MTLLELRDHLTNLMAEGVPAEMEVYIWDEDEMAWVILDSIQTHRPACRPGVMALIEPS